MAGYIRPGCVLDHLTAITNLKPLQCSTGRIQGHQYYSFYHHLEGRIGFNTVNPFLSTGKDYPVHSLMMNRMAVLHQNSGVIGKSTPLPRFNWAWIADTLSLLLEVIRSQLYGCLYSHAVDKWMSLWEGDKYFVIIVIISMKYFQPLGSWSHIPISNTRYSRVSPKCLARY